MKINLLKYLNLWYIREPLLFIVMFNIFFGEGEVYLEPNVPINMFCQSLIGFTLLYGYAQLVNYFILPYWLDKGRFWDFVGILIVSLLGFSLIFFYVDAYMFKEIYIKYPSFKQTYISALKTVLSSLFVISSIAFIKRMYENEKRQNEAKLLINQLEINQLKAQINPHFLFNTLNNLYGVSLEEPHRTPDLIMQLSQLMRYQVEAGQKETVTLKEELEFVESFIALEKERVGQRCMVKIKEDIVKNDFQIAPMLLIPVIENAFKHGTATTDKCWVHLFINCDEEGNFVLMVRNSLPTKPKTVASTGVGMDNTRKRLERLYPNNHNINVTKTETYFDVIISIKLLI
jgi:two-component system, LytTR family, sensor kinase